MECRGSSGIKGYTAPEIIGKHFRDVLPAEDRAAEASPRPSSQAALADGRVEDHRLAGAQRRRAVLGERCDHAAVRRVSRHVGFGKITRDLTDRSYRRSSRRPTRSCGRRTAQGRANADSPSWRAFTGQSEADWRGCVPGIAAPSRRPARACGSRGRAASRAAPCRSPEFRLRRRDGVYVWMTCRAIRAARLPGRQAARVVRRRLRHLGAQAGRARARARARAVAHDAAQHRRRRDRDRRRGPGEVPEPGRRAS